MVTKLSTKDPDTDDTFTYSLINGEGDHDNPIFQISGDQLLINTSPDFETKDSYSIRLQAMDSSGLTLEKAFKLNVTDVNEAPSELAISKATFTENIPAGSTIATFSSTDPDSGESFSYSLVKGDGDTDNENFLITNDQLLINATPDFETKKSYSIRLRVQDSGALAFEKTLN